MTALQKQKAPARQRQSLAIVHKTTVLNQYIKPAPPAQVAIVTAASRVLPNPNRPILRLVTPTSTRTIIMTMADPSHIGPIWATADDPAWQAGELDDGELPPHLEPNAVLEGNFDYIDADSEQNEARFAALITANAANTPRPKPRNQQERVAARRTYRPNRASRDWQLLDELGVL